MNSPIKNYVKETREKAEIHQMVNFDCEPENPIKVSIVVPVCNVEPYLHECLDSCVNQTLKDIEIICVNDGSSDNSLDILLEYAMKDKRVKVIDKENAGYGHTMNIGMDMAQGEYIGIVESDDFVELDMYEELYNIAKENELDFIKADFNRFVYDENGDIKKTLNEVAFRAPELYNEVINPKDEPIVFSFIMQTWSGIYKREFLTENNIRHNETPGASYQDNGFWFQTFMFAERVYFYDKQFYMNRRDNPNSSVHNKAKVYIMNDEYEFIKKILLNHPDLYEQFKYIFTRKKFLNYLFTFRRIGIEFKYEYLLRIQNELLEVIENDELDWELFEDRDRADLELILTNPEDFFRREIEKPIAEKYNKNLIQIKRQAERYKYNIENEENNKFFRQKQEYKFYNSVSYKMHKVFSLLPDKFESRKQYNRSRRKNNRVHVAFITDENYSMPTAVAITSLKENRNKRTEYCIHIIANNISKYSRDKFIQCEGKNFSIDIIDAKLDSVFSNIHKKDKDLHVSPSALLKMRLPEILDKIGKVIYIDGDVLIQNDLLELYNTDIRGKFAAVVKDIISERNPNHMKSVDIKNHYYFNSGVMLLNLTKMRKENITRKLIDYRLNKKNHFVDQDALNAVFNENVYYISWRYNYLNKFHDWWDGERLSVFYGEYVPKNKITAFKRASIIHLGSHEKPWVYDMGYLTKLYRKYYKKSPYKINSFDVQTFEEPQIYLDSMIKISEREQLTLRDLIEKYQINRSKLADVQSQLDVYIDKIDSESASFYDDYLEMLLKNERLKEQLRKSDKKLKNIRKSKTFRAGRMITWLPRKMKRFFVG